MVHEIKTGRVYNCPQVIRYCHRWSTKDRRNVTYFVDASRDIGGVIHEECSADDLMTCYDYGDYEECWRKANEAIAAAGV